MTINILSKLGFSKAGRLRCHVTRDCMQQLCYYIILPVPLARDDCHLLKNSLFRSAYFRLDELEYDCEMRVDMIGQWSLRAEIGTKDVELVIHKVWQQGEDVRINGDYQSQAEWLISGLKSYFQASSLIKNTA